MKLTRRQAMQIFGLAGLSMAGSIVLPNKAWAQAAEGSSADPHHILLLRMNGAWDVMMAMDAKNLSQLQSSGVTNRQLLYSEGRKELRRHGSAYLGSAFAPLFPYLDDIAILNGLMMIHDNPVHEVNRSYMSSGSVDTSVGFGPFQIARAFPQRDMRIGFRMENEQLLDGGYSKKVPLSSLQQILGDGDEFSGIFNSRAQEASEADRGSQVNLMLESRREQKVLENLQTLIKKMIPQTSGTVDAGMMSARLGLAGLASGYLQGVSCDLVADGNLDTHSQHQVRHQPALTLGFQNVAELLRLMKETMYQGPGANGQKSLFDVTTVVVMSEFSRTSAAQNEDGTNHNQINNSAVIFGKNIRGGAVIGESGIYKADGESLLHASLFDFNLQRSVSKEEMSKLLASQEEQNIGRCQASNCQDYIYPETLWRTIGRATGLTQVPGLEKGNYLKGLLKG